jgi:hypothetical protein
MRCCADSGRDLFNATVTYGNREWTRMNSNRELRCQVKKYQDDLPVRYLDSSAFVPIRGRFHGFY